ncbi:hypothetical protein AAMO2058_000355900 [Amorphochlora amoebiformis]
MKRRRAPLQPRRDEGEFKLDPENGSVQKRSKIEGFVSEDTLIKQFRKLSRKRNRENIDTHESSTNQESHKSARRWSVAHETCGRRRREWETNAEEFKTYATGQCNEFNTFLGRLHRERQQRLTSNPSCNIVANSGGSMMCEDSAQHRHSSNNNFLHQLHEEKRKRMFPPTIPSFVLRVPSQSPVLCVAPVQHSPSISGATRPPFTRTSSGCRQHDVDDTPGALEVKRGIFGAGDSKNRSRLGEFGNSGFPQPAAGFNWSPMGCRKRSRENDENIMCSPSNLKRMRFPSVS